jgi:DNA transformation protein
MAAAKRIKNIGPQTSAWLDEIGIETEEDLRRLGSVEAYRQLKARFPSRVTLNALWGMESALLGIHWQALPAEIKAALLLELGDDA